MDSSNEQAVKETVKAHAAFLAYCEMGYNRSLEKLAHKLGKTSAYTRCLEAWSSQYRWQERVKEYDEAQAKARLKESEELARQKRAEEERQREEDLEAVRKMLLRHVNVEIEPVPTSQIQAGKLLIEHYVVVSDLVQMKEQLQALQEKLEEIEATP